MTSLGKNIASDSAESIRSAVLDFAARRGWSVILHRSFAEWALGEIASDGRTWVVLDPLLPIDNLGSRVRSVRLSRQFDNNEPVVVRQYSTRDGAIQIQPFEASTDVALVDDAAASGNTLRYVSRLVAQAGGEVSQVRLCASSRAAREACQSQSRGTKWNVFVRGDWSVIHLRDGCPHLPHSGRPTGQPAVAGVDGGEVEVRVPSSLVVGNYWQVLSMDTGISRAIGIARAEIARRLSVALDRPACVRDLSLLGPSVPAFVLRGETATGDLTLQSLAMAKKLP